MIFELVDMALRPYDRVAAHAVQYRSNQLFFIATLPLMKFILSNIHDSTEINRSSDCYVILETIGSL